jgi:predicted permease
MQWWRSKKRDADLERELLSDLECEEEEQRERGLSANEARSAARRAFGNMTLIREQTRAAWGWGWLEHLVRDVKYGTRTLLRSPEFAIVSVLVMALGIGATTSLFTMVRAVLLRPLPFRDSGKLVMLYEHFRQNKGGDGFNAVAPGDYRDWRSQTHGFEELAAVRGVRTQLLVLLCAVGCMLLIACLNVSNLLVARAAARRKDVAIRGSLGGSRLALIREQMTESLLICVAGGGLGLLLSLALTRWLAANWRNLPRAESVHVDGWVFTFAAGLVLITGLLAGLVPAVLSTGKGLLSALQESSRSGSSGASRARLRRTMLTVEIALTVMLLVLAGLLFKSFLRLRMADLGCRIDHVMTMKFGLPEIQYDTRDKVLHFHQSLLERVRRLPGVQGAALVSAAPGSGPQGDRVFTILERPAPSYSLQYDAITLTADPQYFSVMQIPLLRGRVFTEHERLDNSHYVVVSKQFVDQFFSGDDPIGKHVRSGWDTNVENYEIIGEVGDTLYDVTKPVEAAMYFPILSGIPNRTSEATIVAWTSVDPLAISMPIQQQISALEQELPVYQALTMDQILSKTTASQGFAANLILAFAALSLLLAAVGLYGVSSYLVTQRVAEIGVRIALGAQRQQILRLILFDGLRPALFGLILGLTASTGATQLIRSMLYGTKPYDPPVIATVIFTLLLIALIACIFPAWRASRLDPMQALRTE